jgi:hypothetical protein
VVVEVSYRNPDISPDPAGIAQAVRAVKLPKRRPTDDDRPRRKSRKPNVIAGQVTVDEMIVMIENEDGDR